MLALLCGCQTDKSKPKDVAALRVHIETNPGADRLEPGPFPCCAPIPCR